MPEHLPKFGVPACIYCFFISTFLPYRKAGLLLRLAVFVQKKRLLHIC